MNPLSGLACNKLSLGLQKSSQPLKSCATIEGFAAHKSTFERLKAYTVKGLEKVLITQEIFQRPKQVLKSVQ
jgi:hypothetical protein